MNNRKNYNSIVFLTVYLGLVLVGATPQVLSQAALTRQFDVLSEIEFKDDLDNKPDDEPCALLKAQTGAPTDQFFEQYAQYVLSLLKASYAGGGQDIDIRGSLLDSSFPVPRQEFSEGFADFKIDRDSFFGNFHFKSKLKSQNLAPIAAAYRADLELQRCASKNKSEKTVLDNTEISFENDQIFVVTRLARASIDPLLARNAR